MPANLLVGRWRLVSQQLIVDGKEGPDGPVPDKSPWIRAYAADGTWLVAAGPVEAVRGTYRWIGPDRIRSVIVESLDPSAVGIIRTEKVEVDDRQLRLTQVRSAEDARKAGVPAKPGSKYPPELVIILTLRRLPD